MSFLRKRRRRLGRLQAIKWLAPPLGRRTLPVPVILNRFAAARFVFIFGIVLPFEVRTKGEPLSRGPIRATIARIDTISLKKREIVVTPSTMNLVQGRCFARETRPTRMHKEVKRRGN